MSIEPHLEGMAKAMGQLSPLRQTQGYIHNIYIHIHIYVFGGYIHYIYMHVDIYTYTCIHTNMPLNFFILCL